MDNFWTKSNAANEERCAGFPGPRLQLDTWEYSFLVAGRQYLNLMTIVNIEAEQLVHIHWDPLPLNGKRHLRARAC